MSVLLTYFVKTVLGSSFATANSSPVRAFFSPVNKTEDCLPRIRLLGFLFVTALTLSSCGFQLAGTTPSSAGVDSLFVESRVSIQQLIDQPVAEQLLDDLGASGVEILGKLQTGIPGLVIVNEENIERGLSLTTGLFDRQVALEKRVQYQILDASGNILAADAISATRELIDDPATPSAKHAEREILISAINRDISRQLIRRFNAALANQ